MDFAAVIVAQGSELVNHPAPALGSRKYVANS
jgi:hypothetical protein